MVIKGIPGMEKNRCLNLITDEIDTMWVNFMISHETI